MTGDWKKPLSGSHAQKIIASRIATRSGPPPAARRQLAFHPKTQAAILAAKGTTREAASQRD